MRRDHGTDGRISAMNADSPGLARRFLATRGTPTTGDHPSLGERLGRCLAEGRAAWPALALEPGLFVDALARAVQGGRFAIESLDGLRSADLYLATACLHRVPGAQETFDATILSQMPSFLAGMRADDVLIDATRQELREKLFVGTSRSSAKIAQYGGRGSLSGWVRVAAVRAALNRIAVERKALGREEPIAKADVPLPDGASLELDYLKARYKVDVGAAVRDALADLDAEDRTLLRFRYVEGLSPGRIAELYAVHRTTILRRLEAAMEGLLRCVRRRVGERLGVHGDECDSLLAMVQSQLDITLGGLMQDDPR